MIMASLSIKLFLNIAIMFYIRVQLIFSQMYPEHFTYHFLVVPKMILTEFMVNGSLENFLKVRSSLDCRLYEAIFDSFGNGFR